MTAAVSLRGVSFWYPDSEDAALFRVNLDVEEGSFALVTGPTGAGKSTLLRSMNGLVPHFTGGRFAGRVRTGGRDTLEVAPRHLADVVAYVPQDPGSAFVVDRVEDELAYGMENLGIAPPTMRRRVEETLDLLNLEPLRDRSVRSLSGGERQRVALAAALTSAPRVLLLDEPTSQLDPQGAEDVLAALQRLVHDLGITVIAAEHRLERVAGFVDVAIGCLAGGRVHSGDPARVLELTGAGPPVTRLGKLVGWTPPPLTVRAARRAASAAGLTLPPHPSQARKQAGEGPGARVVGLDASYGAAPALRGIDLTLRRGEITALLGRNGAGKTTLLRVLTGLHRPDRGRVLVDGGEPRPGRNVALCPQVPETILFHDTVAGEIAATLVAAGKSEASGPHLAAMGLEDVAGAHPRDLSAGERLLVAVAATSATGAPLLLLDEPTRGLDLECKRRLAAFLRGLAERSCTAVLATHDVELAAEVADRCILLASGEVIGDGPTAEVLGDSPVFAPQMSRVFGPGWLTPAQVARALVPT